MAKRRTDGRNAARYDSEDNLIDIDGAFAPTKGRQSVEYDVGDERIGLTQAFGAIVPEEEPEYGWNDDRKWDNFDWNASFGDTVADEEEPGNGNAEGRDRPPRSAMRSMTRKSLETSRKAGTKMCRPKRCRRPKRPKTSNPAR